MVFHSPEIHDPLDLPELQFLRIFRGIDLSTLISQNAASRKEGKIGEKREQTRVYPGFDFSPVVHLFTGRPQNRKKI